jgi:protein O-mannosyl-transferase
MAKSKSTRIDSPKTHLSQNTVIAWPALLSQPKTIGIAIFLIAFGLYLYSASFGFVLDDAIVITDNMFTQEGVSGIDGILTKDTFFGFFKEAGKENVVSGGRYRPFTLVLFAIMYSVFGKSAMPYHLLTILLYAATCWMIFQCLRLCLRTPDQEEQPKSIAIAAITALLFAVHPVHVEVVANIKGCDEIMSLLGSIGALYLTILAYDKKQMKLALAASLVFLTGLFSKENAFLFILLIPAALYFFRRASRPEIVKYAAPSIAAGLFFFIVRGVILKLKLGLLAPNANPTDVPRDLMNNPFLKVENNLWVDFDTSERLATIFHTLAKYLKLIVVPHPLTHDYYPKHIDVKGFSDPFALLAVILYATLGFIMYKRWKAGDGVSFGILTFFLTLFLVSNFIFPIGTIMGERFLFMPSFGILLVLVIYAIEQMTKRNQTKALFYGVGVIALLFSIKTLTRLPAWQSNSSLFKEDIKVSKRSAKLLNAMGGTLYDESLLIKNNEPEKQKVLMQSIQYLNAALEIHPTYKNAYLLRANCYFYLKKHDECVKDYKEALRIDPNFKDAKNNLSIALRDAGKAAGEQERNLEKAFMLLKESYQLNPKDAETLRLLGVANGVKGEHTTAIDWFTKALALDPENPRLLYDLGTAYLFVNQPARAADFQQKALAIQPDLKTAPTN